MAGYRKGSKELLEKLENDIIRSCKNLMERSSDNEDDVLLILARLQIVHDEFSSKWALSKELETVSNK